MNSDPIYGSVDSGFGQIEETNKYSYLEQSRKSDISPQVQQSLTTDKEVETLINQKYAQKKKQEPQNPAGSGKQPRKFLFRSTK